jgi:choline dehydrogenase-like flavoprotein
VGLVADRLPLGLKGAAPWISDRITGLLAIAEDEASRENGVTLSRRFVDFFGLSQAVIHHRYTPRDLEARRTLVRRARRILKEAGAAVTVEFPITTFSHAVGTLRMGENPWTSPLDPHCRFRGSENLYVIDGSFMPTSGGVNPSLTIGANALRSAAQISGARAEIPSRGAVLPFETPTPRITVSENSAGGPP